MKLTILRSLYFVVKVMGNIGRFYTLCGEWKKKEQLNQKKKKIAGTMNDPVKVIMFFKCLKLSIPFSIFFLPSRVQKFHCKNKNINLWNWIRCS